MREKMKGKQTFDSFDVLYIELTGHCNFNCVHCGNEENGRNLDFNLIEKMLDEFNAEGGKKLILTGGEPLLHPRLEEILKITAKHNYNTKLSTNASLLNHPHYAYVLDYDLGFRVSLDGTREVHNQIRGNPDAYNSLISAMHKMSEKEKQIVIRTTVMKNNAAVIPEMIFELDRLVKEEGLQIYSNNLWPMRGIGKANRSLMLTASEYRDFIRRLNREIKELRPDFRIIIGPTFGLESEFAGGPIQSNDIYKCDLLNTSLHIAYNGDIYPCSFVHYPLGNVAQTSFKKVFRSEEAKKFRKLFLDKENHDCQGCQVYESCKSGCLAEKYPLLLDSTNHEQVKDVYCFREV